MRNQLWWPMPGILHLKQENCCQFEDSLCYIVSGQTREKRLTKNMEAGWGGGMDGKPVMLFHEDKDFYYDRG